MDSKFANCTYEEVEKNMNDLEIVTKAFFNEFS